MAHSWLVPALRPACYSLVYHRARAFRYEGYHSGNVTGRGTTAPCRRVASKMGNAVPGQNGMASPAEASLGFVEQAHPGLCPDTLQAKSKEQLVTSCLVARAPHPEGTLPDDLCHRARRGFGACG